MSTVEAVSSGIVTCYLSRSQMTALLRQAEAEGLSRQQIVKRAIVELLIEEGGLPETERQRVLLRQKELTEQPLSHKKEIGDLRVAKKMTEDDLEKEARNTRLRAELDRINGRVQPETAAKDRATRRRRRRSL